MSETTDKPRPCLYMLWPHLQPEAPQRSVESGYRVRVYRKGDDERLIELNRSDGESMSIAQWNDYLDHVLPDGLFVGEHETSGTVVATAGAVHNPNPGRYHFAFGGELGYLIVASEHRRRGLGGVMCAAVIARFLSAGYSNIRVCVQEHRLPAIRTYFGVGFEPLLHSPDVAERWQQVCSSLGRPYHPDDWPTQPG